LLLETHRLLRRIRAGGPSTRRHSRVDRRARDLELRWRGGRSGLPEHRRGDDGRDARPAHSARGAGACRALAAGAGGAQAGAARRRAAGRACGRAAGGGTNARARHAEVSRALAARGADPRARRRLDGRRARHRVGRRTVPTPGIAPRRSPAGARAASRPADGTSLMRLGTLLDGLGAVAVEGSADIEVTGVAADSRRVRPGDVFFALAGQATDGRRHAAEALARGAGVVIADGEVEAPGAPRVRCREPRRLLGPMAARLAGDPSAGLTLVGITGTNGKTTTTYLLEGIWRAAGGRPGVIGTIAYRFAGASRPAPFTTPEAPQLHAILTHLRRAGVTHVAIEGS